MRKITYTIKQAFIQLFRNRAMTLTSIFAMMAMLLILGLFFAILVNVNMAASVIKQDYDTIEVFLEDHTSKADANAIIQDLQDQDGVESVGYRTRDEALDILKQRWGKSAYLLDSLKSNPLPNSIVIKINKLEKADHIAKKAATYNGIEDVKYYKETVAKLIKITKYVQWGALVMMAFLIVVSLVIVANTIKLTVFARSQEITIMKYVGATNWFIRGPFLAEGIIMGLISAGLSVGILAIIYTKLTEVIGKDVMSILSMPLVPADFFIENVIWIFVALGVSIGVCGSIISMRRFLDT